MQSVDEMARQRNVSIARLQGLEVATISVDCAKPVDIGFYVKEKMRFVNPLSWLPKAEIRPGLLRMANKRPTLLTRLPLTANYALRWTSFDTLRGRRRMVRCVPACPREHLDRDDRWRFHRR